MPDEPQVLYRLTVEGEPQAKLRARLDRRNMRIYNPSATTKAEHDIGWRFQRRYPGIEPDKVMRFAVRLVFHCGRPGSGDCDNKIKTVLDGLQKIVWANDKQVDEIHALIVHGASQPRTEIEIYRKRPEWR